MKALVIHPWHNVKESHTEALQSGIRAALEARGVEPIMLNIPAEASSIDAHEALSKVIFDLEPNDFILYHGSSFPEVMEMVAYAMRTLAPLCAPPSLNYHFMPLCIFTNMPVDAWHEYQKGELLFSGIISMFAEGKEAEDIDEEELVEAVSVGQ